MAHMEVKYLPHHSNNPHELLVMLVLWQAYVDIYNYFKSGQPANHEGVEALEWLHGGNGTLSLVVQTIQNIQGKHNWSFVGDDEESIKANLIKRISAFKRLAEGKEDKEAKQIIRAYQLMTG
jgi:hypothetical protein